jgi:hypothetical protein
MYEKIKNFMCKVFKFNLKIFLVQHNGAEEMFF